MRFPRLSIGRMMGLVLLSAIGLVGLFRPDPVFASLAFTTAVVVLIVAVLNAALGAGHRRASWLGFAVAGWVSRILAFGIFSSEGPGAPSLFFSPFLDKLQAVIRPDMEIVGQPIYLRTAAGGGFLPTPVPPPGASPPPAKLTIGPASPPAPATAPSSAVATAPPGVGIVDPAAMMTLLPPPTLPPQLSPSPLPTPPPFLAAMPTISPTPGGSGGVAFSALTTPGGTVLGFMSNDVTTCFQQSGESLGTTLAGVPGGSYALFFIRRIERAATADEDASTPA